MESIKKVLLYELELCIKEQKTYFQQEEELVRALRLIGVPWEELRIIRGTTKEAIYKSWESESL